MTRIAGRYAVMALVLTIVLLPIYWMAAASLKTNKEITQEATLYPHAPTFDNFTHLFAFKNFENYLLNSIAVTVLSVLLALAIGSPAAYAIARFRLPFGLDRRIGLSLLVMRIVPPVVILIPIYLFMLRFGLLDTWAGLIITYTALNVTYCVWMMESFFRDIPPDLEEAAMVDGDSRFGAFRRIVLPAAAPGMVATSIFAVIVTFNEFMFALVLTSTPRSMTMPRGTATLIGRIDTDWASMSAAGVLGALPIVIFAFLVQKHLVRGLTLGAVK